MKPHFWRRQQIQIVTHNIDDVGKIDIKLGYRWQNIYRDETGHPVILYKKKFRRLTDAGVRYPELQLHIVETCVVDFPTNLAPILDTVAGWHQPPIN